MLKKSLTNALALSLVFGTMMSTTTNGKVEDVPYERPKGYDHKVRTEEEKARKKAHKKKLKARRNAKKGIYETKIVYKKGKKYAKEN